MSPSHVLIIGGGITGLTLAQAIRKRNATNPTLPPITFAIYERDAHALSRGAGWGMTLHWALQQFRTLLPQDLVDRFQEAYTDKDAAAAGNLGNFRLYNMQTGKDDFLTPPGDSDRHRFAREKLRKLLMDELDVQWSKTLVDIEYPATGEVIAQFSDGTSAKGDILIGADGSRSQVRRVLCPTKYANNVQPIRFVGVSVPFPPETVKAVQALDRYFFQCCDPATDAFMFCGFLDTPTAKDQEAANGTLPVTCQLMTSWPYKAGTFGSPEPIDVPVGNEARLAWMKKITSGWVEPFRGLVQAIPEDTETKVVSLEDWPPRKGAWDNHGGRVTMIGDAAHAMTMYRGEAANHGIADITVLLEQFFPENHQGSSSPSIKEKIDAYELEMIERTRPAVLRSRQACLHAHDYPLVTTESPLIAKRTIVVDDEA